MKTSRVGPLLVAALLLAACAHAPLVLPPESAGVLSTLEGTEGKHAWTMPDGRPGESTVLRLEQPVILNGRVHRLVELKRDERLHVGWDEYVGRQLKLQCVVGEASMWGYPHLWCNVQHVERVR